MNSRHWQRAKRAAFAMILLGTFSSTSWALPQSTFSPAGPVAQRQMELMQYTLVFAATIFVVVGGALFYAILRFRRRSEAEVPRQIDGNHRLEVAWFLLPISIVISLAIPTVRGAFHVANTPENALAVDVIAHQWWFEMDYPAFGINTGNELHIPVGQPIQLTLHSADVIHSFWVPRLAGKVDLVPGRENEMWLQADEPGVYYGQCAEYCGTAHAQMRFRVVAHTADEFDDWVERRQSTAVTGPPASSNPVVARGREVFETRGCIACHAIDGTVAQGRVGPNLTGFGSRLTLAAGTLDNTPENLARWIEDPQDVKPGAKMPDLGLSTEEIGALVAYLHSLN